MMVGRHEKGSSNIHEEIAKRLKELVESVAPVEDIASFIIGVRESLDFYRNRIPNRWNDYEKGNHFKDTDGCDSVYSKPEENAAYWVKGKASGVGNLW